MDYKITNSELTPIADTIEMSIHSGHSHSFAGIRYYDSSKQEIVPTSGSVLIEAKHLTNGNYDSVVNGKLSANIPGDEANWGGNATSVKATPTSLTGSNLAYFQLVVVQNVT